MKYSRRPLRRILPRPQKPRITQSRSDHFKSAQENSSPEAVGQEENATSKRQSETKVCHRYCPKCGILNHVSLGACKGCKFLFPLRPATKVFFEPCEIQCTESTNRHLYSIRKSTAGIPSRGFVIFDRVESKWTCFCHQDQLVVAAGTSLAVECQATLQLSASDGAQISRPSKTCKHILECVKCTRVATPISVPEDSVRAVCKQNSRACVDEILGVLNDSSGWAQIARTTGDSFAIRALSSADFEFKRLSGHEETGYVHAQLREHANCRQSPARALHFSCQCGPFQKHSCQRRSSRCAPFRCRHYFILMAAIHGDRSLRREFHYSEIRDDVSVGRGQLRQGSKSTGNAGPDRGLLDKPLNNQVSSEPPRGAPVYHFNEWALDLGRRINECLYPFLEDVSYEIGALLPASFLLTLCERLEQDEAALTVVDITDDSQDAPPASANEPLVKYQYVCHSNSQVRSLFPNVPQAMHYRINADSRIELASGPANDGNDGKLLRCRLNLLQGLAIDWIENLNDQANYDRHIAIRFIVCTELYS